MNLHFGRQLCSFSAARRVFVFCGFVPTFHRQCVVCLLSVHADDPWCFRTPLVWLPSCPFPLAPRAWWQHRCFPRWCCFGETRYYLLFSCILTYLFLAKKFFVAHQPHLVMISSITNVSRFHVVDDRLSVESSHRCHIIAPVMALQPTGSFCFIPFFLLDCTCHQGSPVIDPRSDFAAKGLSPLCSFFFSFIPAAYMPQGSKRHRPPYWLCSQQVVFC